MEIMKTFFVRSQSVPDVRKTASFKISNPSFLRGKKKGTKITFVNFWSPIPLYIPVPAIFIASLPLKIGFEAWISFLSKTKKSLTQIILFVPEFVALCWGKITKPLFCLANTFSCKFFLFVCLVSALSNSKLKLSNLIHLSC